MFEFRLILKTPFNPMKPLQSLLLILCLLSLVACQNVPQKQADDKLGGNVLTKNAQGRYIQAAFVVPEKVREKVAAWSLSGSFSYVDPKESGAGRIQWQYQGILKDDFIDKESVRLVGPIGTGSLELVSSSSSARLVAGRKNYLGASVDDLLLDIVGWRMPVEEMRYWLFGMPSPHASGRFWLNEQGKLQSLHQSDWEIVFDRYETVPELNAQLPRKITAVHRVNQAKVKLLVKQFEPQLQ